MSFFECQRHLSKSFLKTSKDGADSHFLLFILFYPVFEKIFLVLKRWRSQLFLTLHYYMFFIYIILILYDNLEIALIIQFISYFCLSFIIYLHLAYIS